MKTFPLLLTDNPPGTDPVQALYAAINHRFPTSNSFNPANSHIDTLKAWPAKYKPARTYLKLVSNDDPKVFGEFYYDRFDLTLQVKNPLFTDAEGQALKDKTGVEVLAAIAAKTKLNLTPDEFWVEEYAFTSTGGTKTPNFRLKPRHDSPFWYNELIVWLHTA